ncbi:hypothetical protein INT45_006680 [Circinella minor]|uniref:Uncharacterized protein n=1 Tax=Circinella minor TaxID=1195481 RepID=A0A8H7RU72_9FUNG|nr:hypothetical protein INT45_006680 [Circinella minor]
MNPSDYPFPSHNPNQDIYNILWDIRTRVISIETRLTNIENNVGPHPVAGYSISQPAAQQQHQPQQPHYQPHTNAHQQQQQQQQPQQDVQLQPQESISLAQYQQIEAENKAEEEREWWHRSKIYSIKNDTIVFLREEVRILEDDLDSMNEAFLQESRTHRQALEDAWDKNPRAFVKYGSILTAIKTIEVSKFETNIARMYKVWIGRCEKHWIADYFIHSVYNSIKGGNTVLTVPICATLNIFVVFQYLILR